MGLAVIFSGQGNQNLQMFAKFFNEINCNFLELVEKDLQINVFPEITLSQELLYTNRYSQPLITCYEFLVWSYLKPLLVEPICFAGYSLGELSAFCAASECEFEQLYNLAGLRAKLMASFENNRSGLLAVSGCDASLVYEICTANECYMAIRNSALNSIIGGTKEKLAICKELISKIPGVIRLNYLDVAVAAHTPLLVNASHEFAAYLQTDYSSLTLKHKLVTGINSRVHYTISDATQDLALQISQTIYFDRVIQVISELGADVILEIGPGRALASIVNQYKLPVKAKAIDEFNSLKEVAKWVETQLANSANLY